MGQRGFVGAVAAHAQNQLVGAEGLAIEKRTLLESHPLVEVQVLGGLDELFDIDAERTQEAVRDPAVRTRAVDFQRAAVQEIEMATEIEFVALRMPAEVVVIVENEDAARAAGALAIEMRGGE